MLCSSRTPTVSGSGEPHRRRLIGGHEVTRLEMAAGVVRPIAAGVILLFGYFLLPINAASNSKALGFLVGVALLIAFCGYEIHHFLRSPYPVVTALEMLVALATFYVIAFATMYFIFSDYDHGSFTEKLTRIDALYFSLTVFTTTGFGDIAAVAQETRVAVSIQMVSTFALLGLGIRFLSLLVSARRKPTGHDGPVG
ncbi:MAG TPA: two pore domain potassium channel family protein [Gordonia polyisoprenivorans]|uniref:Two pore domain potassium channel family protein n=1 Tax=Gordonia polyisoprenivorans TaxID=84595 RepID=A0A846WI47_9ACTN|nr:two pore domain potassium channel family protein [Gordonia polyisoprenivorans]OPX11056.1 ion transporter [Gordonia sp. i37]NKY00749.1 two pore domain potassium channel family protein [Gordonia polyisoprenivorans]OZC33513.1 ion transporter [Gordonia polyisoprenivorans]QUD82237.1 two pore domain potassium channel family protein [Gordonia polyisoprenivorans]